MSCEKHKQNIINYNGDLDDLVNEIGDLHYKTLTEFFEKLSLKIENDGKKDFISNRRKLAKELQLAADNLKNVKTHINNAWLISKPFMKNI